MTIFEPPLAPTPPATWRPRATFGLVLSYFVLFGILLGGQGVIWPDVLNVLRVSDGVFGTAQLVSPLVAIFLLLLGGHFSATFGKKRLAILSLLSLSASVIALSQIRGLGTFIASLLLAGIGNGLMETTMNAAS